MSVVRPPSHSSTDPSRRESNSSAPRSLHLWPSRGGALRDFIDKTHRRARGGMSYARNLMSRRAFQAGIRRVAAPARSMTSVVQPMLRRLPSSSARAMQSQGLAVSLLRRFSQQVRAGYSASPGIARKATSDSPAVVAAHSLYFCSFLRQHWRRCPHPEPPSITPSPCIA